MRRWIMRLLDWIRYGNIYPPTDWQREPDEPLMVHLPPLPEVEHVHYSTGVWTAVYLTKHPELKRPVEFFSDEDWERIAREDEAIAASLQDTRKITSEQTARYKTLPRWMKS